MIFRRSISWVVSMALAGLSFQPVFSQEVSASSESKSSNTTIIQQDKGGTMRWRTSNGYSDFNIEMRGRIELTEDDKDIKSISDDGYLEINKTVFGSKRSIVIESLGGGKMKREYYEGRTKMDWEPNGKAWLGEILPDIVRNTTIAAEARVNRFFKQGGTAAVLAEIDKIDSDHVKSHYANLLMKQPVQTKDYVSIVNKVAEEVNSDHYMSEFLRKNISKFMQSKEATTAVFAATRRIGSDHYKTEVIKEALRGQAASPENVRIILQAAGQMESDHYISEVLRALLNQNNLSDAVMVEMINTTNNIESDHYRSEILRKALQKNGLSSLSYQRVIESIKGIESDHYITEVIKDLLNSKLTDEHLTLLLDVTGSIESDHYRSDVLRTLLSRQDLTDAQFGKVIDNAGHIGSDHYMHEVLRLALRRPNIEDSKVIAVLNTTRRIDSDHYATEVLLEAAPRVKNGSVPLRDAYRNAAREIGSETYYGRALKAIE